MMSLIAQRAGLCLVAIGLTLLPVQQAALAAIIKTDSAIAMSQRQQQVDRVNELLARQEVQDMLVSLGVDPADAKARVETLTAGELQTLEQRLNQLPAGGTGVIEVVGIVAVVLIILELLHVTNFFTEF